LNIVDNDGSYGIIQFSDTAYTVNENGTSITTITLTRSNGSDEPVSAYINLVNGSAKAGSDYLNTPILVNFADGETTRVVNVPLINDQQYEPNETVLLSLAYPQGGARLGAIASAVLTINSDDPGDADLKATAVSLPSEVFLNLSTRVEWMVQNIGISSTDASWGTDAVYV
jgi:hypothetical protein